MKPDERGGDEGVEHDRAAPALGLAGADQGERAVGRLGADRLGVERAGIAAEADAEAGHQVLALARERRGVGPGLGGRVGGREAARVGERHAALGVGVDGVLDLGDALAAPRAARSISSASSTLRSVVQSAISGDSRPSTARRAGLVGQAAVLVRVGHRAASRAAAASAPTPASLRSVP